MLIHKYVYILSEACIKLLLLNKGVNKAVLLTTSPQAE